MLALLAFSISAAEVPYAQFQADRYYLGKASAPRPQPAAPWPDVALPEGRSLVTTAFHTVFLDRAGTVHLLSIAGDVVAPKCFANALGPAGAALVGSYGTAGVVACSTQSCAWCLCPDEHGCTTDGQAAWSGASPTAIAVSPASGTVYAAAASGLWQFEKGAKPTRFGRQVEGNISAMAAAVSGAPQPVSLTTATSLRTQPAGTRSKSHECLVRVFHPVVERAANA